MTNRYNGKCKCGKTVKAYEGHAEKINHKWLIMCSRCYDISDNSSYEDRECGNRAYEDNCARLCGY